ncbi:metal-dependent hydrolase [Methylomonas methanica]|uniref:Metal-dependent hydrolase n=1 Tax=Methylomonas methanica TaxID=421 RepID=A0A177MUH7_METMH|nr:SprT family zinc-dependent metalloprotease [Methylomonas methanica]OAI09301.1 metal-dependent hydrolase [Methylomonas methanica]
MPQVQIGSLSLQLNRKAIKNLHISVLPPDGRIRVAAPEQMTDTAIRMAVISRIPWIKKQQRDFAAQPRQSDREMVSGECHYFWGKRHRLNLVERVGRHEVKVSGGKIHLFVNPGTSVENRALVLAEFYRARLKAQVEKLIPEWQQRVAVELADWSVKKMKTKWGSCNVGAKRIWFNLELAKKPPECLEYILVHELIHLLERKHNERFRAHMDKFMPNWRERRDLLNTLPLAFGTWTY